MENRSVLSHVDGDNLREIFAAAAEWLKANADTIDALNVFPVPDGDTGTNMLLTIQSGLEEVSHYSKNDAGGIADSLARGALYGARGNSGVILSQILTGFAEAGGGKDRWDAGDFVRGTIEASQEAYRGVSNPVEGTILTVVSDMASAAESFLESGRDDILELFEILVTTAERSVSRTPDLLRILREAGVVDAGGQGLYTLTYGAFRFMREKEGPNTRRRIASFVGRLPPVRFIQKTIFNHTKYGYCTEFILKRNPGKASIRPDTLRTSLRRKGSSIIVAGDAGAVRIHVHTTDPGRILSFAARRGTLHQVSVRNMDEQQKEFLARRRREYPDESVDIIAAVPATPIGDVFESLGASQVILVSPKMNPSTGDFLNAVDAVSSDRVIILPNNSDLIPAAQHLQDLTEKTIAVIPSASVPQGVCALISFDTSAGYEENIRAMQDSIATVRTLEIIRAARHAHINGIRIRNRQTMAFLDGTLIAAESGAVHTIGKALASLRSEQFDVITMYYGSHTRKRINTAAEALLKKLYPHARVEAVSGGQQSSLYIISLE